MISYSLAVLPALKISKSVYLNRLIVIIRDSILDWTMLDTGFAVLVDARSRAIVAAPEHIYNPGPNDPTQTICEIMPKVCQVGVLANDGCVDADRNTDAVFDEFEYNAQTYVFKGGCVEAEQPGDLTHAVLLMVLMISH